MPFKALDKLSERYAGEYANKVIIDATNPYPERDGEIAQRVRDANYNATEHTSMKFSTASMTKAFNTIKAEDIRDRAFREIDKLAIPFSAQDHYGRNVVKQLITDIGFDAFFIGVLDVTEMMDPGKEIYGKSMTLSELQDFVNKVRVAQHV